MLNENGESSNGEAVEIIPPKKRLRRDPLTSLAGLIGEAGRIYRAMKSSKMDHEKGRSLMWSLAQIRPMIEAEALERIERRLDELTEHAEQRYGRQRGARCCGCQIEMQRSCRCRAYANSADVPLDDSCGTRVSRKYLTLLVSPVGIEPTTL